MTNASQLIEILAGSRLFRDFRHAYHRATGLPLGLRPVETWQLPLREQPGESPWCRLVARHSPACAACLQMQERLARHARSRPATLTCDYGLSETVVPVMNGRQPLGYLQTGQVRLHRPDETAFRAAFGRARQSGAQLDEATAREAYFATPVVAPARMRAFRDLLVPFAEHLALRGNQLVIQTTHIESRLVTRARRFIEQHLDEPIDLQAVARRVNTSIFHFCKQFKKETGTTFTEYLNRRRIERARQLLLQPHRAVCEVAYEAGYQSLTHFNRMFRRITGESPSSYRRRLAFDHPETERKRTA